MSLYGTMRTGVSGMNAQANRLSTVADNIARWQCQVARVLGPSASAGVVYANGGDVTITISWGDQRWDQVAPDATTAFVVRSRL